MQEHNILIFGATGPSGLEIVKQALEAGYQVTAFVRDPSKVTTLPAGVRTAVGDVLDASSVAAAVLGHDVVISTLGNGNQLKNPPCAAGIRNIIAAMEANGVTRLIALSAYGTADSRHGFYGWVLNTLMKEKQRDKEEMERSIASSSLDWTIVRPPVLTMGPRTGRVRGALGIVLRGYPKISRADQAAWMLAEIDERRFVGKKPTLAPVKS